MKQDHCYFGLIVNSLTSSVVSESIAKESSVIVAYHPTIFSGLKSFTLSNPLQNSLLKCAALGISVYSPHTALDSVWGGINDWLAEGLMETKGDGEIRALAAEKLNPSTGETEGGEGRLLTLKEPIAMDILEKRIKSHLKLSQSKLFIIIIQSPHSLVVQVAYADKSRSKPIHTVAICAGSGGSLLLGRDTDVYFTGEMTHVSSSWPDRRDRDDKQAHVRDHSTRFWLQSRLESTSFFVSVFMSLLLSELNFIDSKVDIRTPNGVIFLYSRRNCTTSFSPTNSRIKVWKTSRC